MVWDLKEKMVMMNKQMVNLRREKETILKRKEELKIWNRKRQYLKMKNHCLGCKVMRRVEEGPKVGREHLRQGAVVCGGPKIEMYMVILRS